MWALIRLMPQDYGPNTLLKHFVTTIDLGGRFLGNLSESIMVTKAGIIRGEGCRLQWDSAVHDTTSDQIIHGLHFHHFGSILGKSVKVRVRWYRELTKDMIELSSEWNMNSMGGDIFVYKYARAVDQPLSSAWSFQFYGRHWADGHTTPQIAGWKRAFKHPRVSRHHRVVILNSIRYDPLRAL